jgi:hypothetical protein
MRRFKLTLGMACVLTLGMAGVAGAATSGSTTTTFTVSGGALAITVPASASIGSGAPGTSITATLGPVTVTDTRANLVAAWTTTVSSTDFTTGVATAPETVTKSNVSYWSGPATATTGLGTFTPGQVAAVNAVALSAPATAFSLTAGVGNNSATWDPTLIVAVPAAAVAGLYTGTVTHSVA